MGPWCFLWVVLALLKGLRGQNTGITRSPVTIQFASFDEDKFQGEWYVLGLAGNTLKKTGNSVLGPFITSFRKGNGNLVAIFSMTQGQRCISWSYVLVPLQQPGTYSVKNLEEPEEVQVFDTDYTAFALMFSKRQLTNQFILRIHLLSRSWAIKTKVMNKFICLAKDKMLSKDHVVFPNLRAPFGVSVWLSPAELELGLYVQVEAGRKCKYNPLLTNEPQSWA